MPNIWAAIPFFGEIRLSTVLGAGLIAGVVLWRRRDPLLAAATILAWAASFEIIYNGIGSAVFHWPLGTFWWGSAAVAGWIVLALYLGVRPDWRFGLVFAALMVVWIASGYHANVAGSGQPFNIGAEVLNESAKTVLALAFLVGALGAERKDHVEELVDRDRRARIGRGLHLGGIRAWLDHRWWKVGHESVFGSGTVDEGRGGVVEADDAASEESVAGAS